MHSFLFACVLCVGFMSVTSFRLPPVEEYIYRESTSVELLTLEHPPSYRHRRSEDCTPDHISVRFTADNYEVKLSLQRNYDINVNAPLFVNINGTITQERLVNSENVAVYQDLESGSAILVQCIPSTRKFELFGTFYNGSEELMIEPELNEGQDMFPAAILSDIQGRNAKSKKEQVSQDEDLNEKFTISHHVIYKGKTMRPKETDYILKGDLHPKHRDGAGHIVRNKRATTAYQVELLMVADYSAYSFWLTKSSSISDAKVLLRQFYAFVLNGIDLRYKSVTGSGFTITVLFAGLYIAETPSDALWTESRKVASGSVYQVTATAALADFRTWIQSTPNLPGHDHAMLFTAYDLEANGNNAVAGLAYTEAACTTYSQSIVEDNFDAQLMTIAAHELGHGLGAYHDGTSDGTGDLCLPTQAFIMSASVTLSHLETFGFQYNKNLWKFSSCSLSYLQRYINTLNSTNCLTTLSVGYNSTALSPYDQQNPGQIYSADTQCRYKQGNDSYLCRSIYRGNYTNVCSAFYCQISGSIYCSLGIAAERTTCGDGKWCVAGECVTATEAPSVNDTCPFGDQPGIVAKGLTCTQLVANSSFNCYNYAGSCCVSCQNVYTGIIGCEYGDIAVGCIANNCEFYDNTSLAYCCKTCYVQPTTITTARTSTTTTAAHTTITITPTTTSTTTVRTTTTTAASTSSTLAPTTTQTAATSTTTTSAFPKATDTTVAPTSSSTTAAPTASAATAAPSPSSTTAAPTSTSTTAIPTTSSTTAAPTSTKTTAAPTTSSTTAAVRTASSTITAPTPSSTTAAPTPSSTTAAPTSTTTTVVPTPSSTTSALSPSSTTAAPNPTRTTAAPTLSSTTAALTSSSTTAAPTLSSTTAYSTPSSTTAGPFPNLTTNTLAPSLTTTAKTSSSTTSAPTSSTTTATPTPSSTTAAPTPSWTTAAPTPSSTTSAPTPSSTISAQTPSSTTVVPTQTTSTASPTPITTTSAPNLSSTTAVQTPTTTTAASKSTITTAAPSPSLTATVPSLTTTTATLTPSSTTAATAPSSTTAAPTPSSSTSTPSPSSSILAQTPSSTTSAPSPYLTTAASSPSSTTAVPTQTTSKASPTPTTTTAALTQSSTTAAATPTTTKAAPNSTTTTAAPTPSSTTAAPTPSSTTTAPTLSSTTVAPTPTTTRATPTPSSTTAAPASSATTAAPTPSSTTAASTPTTTTAAPTPSSTTAAPTPSSTTSTPTPRSSISVQTQSSTTSAPTLYLTTAAPSPSSTTAVSTQTILTASPTPTTTTAAPTTTTPAPKSTTTTAAPTPSSTTKAPTPSSTTAAPTPSSTTAAPFPSSTTAAPTPSSTTASPTSTTTAAAPTLSSTTAAPTPTTTTAAPTASSTTAAPPPSSTTAAPSPTTTTVAPTPGPSTAAPTPNSTTAAPTPSSTAAVPNPTATTAAPTPTVSNTITSLPTTSMTATPTTNTTTTTTTTTEQQGTKKTAVTVRLNYNISSADNLSDSSTYARYVDIVGESLREYYTRKVGQDVQINIRDIRRGSLIVQYELVIINTPIAQVALAKANIDLAAGENITVGGQVSGVESMVVENKTVPIGNSSKDHLCTVYIIISGGCPDNYKCVVFNSSPLCQPITTTMDIVPVTVAAAVAGFVIIVAVVALICSLQRQVKNRDKHMDELSNDSGSESEMTLPQSLDFIEGHPKHESSNGQYPNVFAHAHKWYPGYGHSNKSLDGWSGELNSHSYYMDLEH